MERIRIAQPPQPCMPIPEGNAWTYLLNKFVCHDLDRSRNVFGKRFRSRLNMYIEEHPEVVTITNENCHLVVTVNCPVTDARADVLAQDIVTYLKSFEEEKVRLLTGRITGGPPERLEQAHGN
jgi:hypothetical protein